MKQPAETEIADVYIHYPVLRKMLRHFTRALPREAIGFLLGDRFRYGGKEWVEIIDYLPLKAEASEAYVAPLEGSLAEVSKVLSRRGLIVVGWAHSHPGYGCFLSERDIETQRKSFPQSFHVALVMDPYTGEYDIFALKEHGYSRVYFKEVLKR
ncbi:MAG: Mov34/MPN/PAD-1 family protein [Candidatus Nezhaarchaeales archaeon]